ncbi:FecCD family ABC transporter permease [Lactiplantibacillus pentosus]|uniref:FecCD family ABC transporter permease n=1 Tax=Lactiplantibacillus pentosus TaxID=1589 RepID=UPI0021A8D252|nr:iron ABC transporter permease [Lactiplantibacillus pentosus]MCT3287733.1 iron ABC transporter permease [Lactiplantibacillus pentosus]
MKTTTKTWLVLRLSVGVLLIVMLLSLRFGADQVRTATVWQALTASKTTTLNQQIIRHIRVPRVLGAALIGAALAGSGALMQAVTRNPLADSGLLGINAGAGLMLTLCLAFWPHLSTLQTTGWAVVGAAVSAGLIFMISTARHVQLDPTILVLAGIAISSLLTAISEGLALVLQLKQDLAFWYFGGLGAVSWSQLNLLGPGLVVGLLLTLLLAPQLNLAYLTDDNAQSLGKSLPLLRGLALVCAVILSGISVALVGTISFVGLMIPHMSRWLVGASYRYSMPLTLILGATLTVGADLIARLVNPPHETPFGIIISLIGVPCFIYLARKESTTA